MPRIVACMVCAKLERIPDPPDSTPRVPAVVSWDDHGVERDYTFKHDDGSTIMVPEFDPLLEDVVYRHSHGRPDSDMESIKVFPVEQATYDRMDVVTELKKELELATELLWEEVEHYKTEALLCYNKHGNPSPTCVDYLDDSKRIGSDKMPYKYQTFLCHMCPIQQAYVAHEQRKKSGLYDPATAQKFERNRKQRMRRLRGGR